MTKRALPVPSSWASYSEAFLTEATARSYSHAESEVFLTYAKKLYGANLPIIYNSEHFSLTCGYTIEFLYAATNSPDLFYRNYYIPKKSGGSREINEPLTDLRDTQRWILDNVLASLPISPAAKAYRPKFSIRDSARFHRHQNYVIRIDLKDFFPSIGISDVYSVYRSVGYARDVSGLLTGLTTYRGGLPQGAPSSPALSNIVFFPVDEKVFALARQSGFRYTRYADDLVFSGSGDFQRLLDNVKDILNRTRYRINLKKTRIMRKGSRQIVNGVIVNEKLNSPRQLRRWIRQRVYYIKNFGYDDYLMREKISNSNHIEYILGKISFCLMCDPGNIEILSYRDFILDIKRGLI